jgi:hypothetical protein
MFRYITKTCISLHRRAAQAETGPAFGVPEPDEVKVSCPVL